MPLPKSASFFDLFAQNDAASDICGFSAAVTSPAFPTNSDGNLLFRLKGQLGLALTNGLKQKPIPVIIFLLPGVFTAGVLLVLPGVSSIDPDGTSLPSSAPVSLAGDIPRQPEITSSMAGCFLERPVERNEEIHDRDDEEEDSDLGLESDLALNGFEILETLPPFDSKSLPETPRSPPPPPASERGRGGGGLLDLRDR